jgi:hypothetical protein
MALALEQFDNEAPTPTIGGGSGLSHVKDGPLSLRIDTIEHRPVSRNVQGSSAKEHGEAIKVNFTIIGGEQDGVEAHHEWWICNKDNADRFAGELQLIGFDPENWSPKNNRPFSKELEKALKMLPGLQLDAVKDTQDSTRAAGKKTHFLNIRGRTMNKPAVKGKYPDDAKPVDGQPLKFSAEAMNKAVEDAFA